MKLGILRKAELQNSNQKVKLLQIFMLVVLGGDTFGNMTKDELNVVKQKIGETTKEHWQDENFRHKVTESIRKTMQREDVIALVSERTREAMQREEVYKALLAKRASPVVLVYADGREMYFETNKEFREYIADRYNASLGVVYSLLKSVPYRCKRLSRYKNAEELDGAYAYRPKLQSQGVETIESTPQEVEASRVEMD